MNEIHPDILAAASRVTAKRAKTVVDHILKNGFITTEDLSTLYGYEHPPRAARDVREQGIPLETFRVKASNGRTIGAYRFGDPSKIEGGKLGGRKVFAKDLRSILYTRASGRCEICAAVFEERYLQIDHGVPYEVQGDAAFSLSKPEEFLLLCGSCQRSKSWSCEHCENWAKIKSVDVCQRCYWSSPDAYQHVAMQQARRLDLVWDGEDTSIYDHLAQAAESHGMTAQQFALEILKREASAH